eukprot:gene5358-10709_t
MGKSGLIKKDMIGMSALSAKCLRQILRSKSHIVLFIATSFLLLLTAGMLSIGASTRLIGDHTNFPSTKASIECSFTGSSLSHCKQMEIDQQSSQYPLGSLLMKYFSTGIFSSFSSSTTKEGDISKAITSFLLREHPVLGLDDFIYLSNSLLAALQSPESIDFIPVDLLTNIKTQSLVFAPDNDLTRGFVSYLEDNSAQFRSLPYRIETNVPMDIEPCCDDIWALVIMEAMSFGEEDDLLGEEDYMTPPMVTIRMDARKVPDTRNHGFNSERHFLRPLPDKLLYLLSGFITIQSEIQNYLSVLGYGGMESRSHVFGREGRAVANNVSKTFSLNDIINTGGNTNNDNGNDISTSGGNSKTSGTISSSSSSSRRFRQQLNRMLRGRNTDSGSESETDDHTRVHSHETAISTSFATSSPRHHRHRHRVLRTTAESDSSSTTSTSSVHIPVMFGAMPSNPYPLHSYWHQHSAALTLLLMLLFSLPAILVGSAFLREVRDG